MTATDIALKVLAHLDRPQKVAVLEHLRKDLYLTPPFPEPRADNSFNLAKKPAQQA